MVTARNILLFLVGVCALFYSGKTISHLWTYYSLSTKTQATSVSWSPDIHSEEAVYLQAIYHYTINSVDYEGTTENVGPVFRNPWAASQAAAKKNDESSIVWVDPKNPKNSSLIKTFPLKELLYSVILWALTVYFFMLLKINP